MPLLSEEESRRVAEAVEAAEKKTGGEIATAIIAESEDYGFRELVFAVILGFAAYAVAVAFSPALETLLTTMFWSYSGWYLHTLLGLIGLVVGVVAYFAAQIPAVDRLIVSKAAMKEAVARRARRHFMEAGVYDTVDRTGILVFVSVLERRVELIADRGINEKVKPDTWNSIVADLTKGIAAGRTADALVEAVEACGKVLAGNVERRTDDTNELSDGPTQLGRGS